MKTILFLLLVVPVFGYAQKAEKKEVRRVIDQLFEGMRKGDSSMVRKTFFPNATLNTSFVNKKGEAKFHCDSIHSFLNAIGKPHEEVWDERLLSCEIKIDDNLATVWTKYAFYVDNVYSHEGVNAFQLVKTDGSWKILIITDTRRKNNSKIK
ncbi:nuclear transport factor 2 family protein [Fluviicola sp.]|uniref:nuclear transport factor 2 family protein n=1 Tax=Fluviicola sp. TaxID=1917219 RepID=UPI0031D5E58A